MFSVWLVVVPRHCTLCYSIVFNVIPYFCSNQTIRDESPRIAHCVSFTSKAWCLCIKPMPAGYIQRPTWVVLRGSGHLHIVGATRRCVWLWRAAAVVCWTTRNHINFHVTWLGELYAANTFDSIRRELRISTPTASVTSFHRVESKINNDACNESFRTNGKVYNMENISTLHVYRNHSENSQ